MYYYLCEWEKYLVVNVPEKIFRYYNLMLVHRRGNNVAERIGTGRVSENHGI
jgi:hypothetical protein